MGLRLELFKIGFLTVTLIDILDVLIISYILYKLYFFIRGSRAAQMFIGLVIILVASVFVQLLTEEMVKAAMELSKRGYGGLLVIVQDTGIKSILETGQRIQAEIYVPLIVSIFNPRSPLHDGAVIIQNDMIEAAQCILPLSQNPDVDPKFGTRHRAALGLSEETDAVIIVVSEETGKISLAYEGELYAELDYSTLREKLNEFVKITTGV